MSNASRIAYPAAETPERLRGAWLSSAAALAVLAFLAGPAWSQEIAPATPETAPAAVEGQNLTEEAEDTPTSTVSMIPASFADLAAQLSPAVVNISTTQTVDQAEFEGPEMPELPEGSPFEDFFRDFFERRGEGGQGDPMFPPRANALGSGFVIDPEGYIVTNNHVIEGADEIRVTFPTLNRELTAELVGVDDKTDIAVLRVDSDEPLPYVEFGDSDQMRVGDWVLAIGNPFGLGGTVTAGIISAFGRNINAGPYDDFIQTDASINRGNSGGPMFNMDGQVIGINTAIFSPTGGSVGVGFSIPSRLAEPVVNQLIEFGHTRRGWLGVRIQSVTDDIAESLGLEPARGALVASVTAGGPAEAAGLTAGDVILTFNGHPIDEMRELPRLVAETEVESEVDLTVWRDGEIVDVQVTLGELEAAEESGLLAALDENEEPTTPEPETTQLDVLGLTVAGVTEDLIGQYGLDAETRGVVITEVEPNSPAAEKGLQPGEVIVEVGQEEVTSPEQIREKIEQARTEGRRSVLLLVQSEDDMRFVALNVDAS